MSRLLARRRKLPLVFALLGDHRDTLRLSRNGKQLLHPPWHGQPVVGRFRDRSFRACSSHPNWSGHRDSLNSAVAVIGSTDINLSGTHHLFVFRSERAVKSRPWEFREPFRGKARSGVVPGIWSVPTGCGVTAPSAAAMRQRVLPASSATRSASCSIDADADGPAVLH